MNNIYKSNYRYTQRIAKFIESCFQDRLISVKDLARLLDVSSSYIYFLLKKLKNDMYFTIRALTHHKKVRLNPFNFFLSIRSTLHRNIILRSLSRYDYVTYIASCQGKHAGIYCSFLIPDGKESDVKAFFELLLSYGIIEDYTARPLMTIENIVMGFEWYDFSRDVWYFDWPSLLSNVLTKVDVNGYVSVDDFKNSSLDAKFDYYDLLILHHLEHDIFTNIGALALEVGVTPQNLSYHYRNHVRELVKLIEPYWVPFPLEYSSFFVLDVVFEDFKGLRGFIKALQRKPIAYSYAPYELSAYPSIILSGFLPYKEFSNFTSFLDSLKDYGIVKDHDLYLLNIEESAGKALPYHCYDGFEWRFDVEPCVKEILRLVKQSQKSRAKLAKAVDRSIESK